ncbi:MAG: TRAM domain-containing protein [Candidatus Omnitrophica bacterium]|nr:TRAM domain-containing protein [Candidatus Omnitrophota bacterium]
MNGLLILRIFFVFLCTFAGYSLGGVSASVPFAIFGFFVGTILVTFEMFARKVSLKGLSSAVFGVILGLLLAKLGTGFLEMFLHLQEEVVYNARIFITFACVYFGLTLGLKGKSEFSLVIPYVKFKRQELKEEQIVVDTSSIIDGRILDVVKTGFLEARLIIPRFVLNELRALADSTDHLKRQKGKRGIEILHALNKEPMIEVEIYDENVEGVDSVDEKIVKLAYTLDAKILTTDYNLNRIAQLQGGKVLNINDLSNALKPTFIAGERFPLKLIKEGKEQNQSVGYLEDGTMVVVENSRWLIGKTVEVEVTSILQSPSGRIVFTKLVG